MNTDHFIKDEKLRGRFWGAVSDLCAAAGLDKADHGDVVHDALHVDSVRDWAGDADADAETNMRAALRVVATHLVVLTPGRQEQIEAVARRFAEQRLGAVGPRRIVVPGNGAPPAIEKPAAPMAPAHWASDPDNVDKVLAACRDLGMNIVEARAANGLGEDQPLTDFPGTGKQFVANARAARKRALQPPEAPEAPPDMPPVAPAEPQSGPLAGITTLMGIPVTEMSAHMNRRFPPQAYRAITFGPMKDKSDLAGDYVRDRFDAVWGPHGMGWQLVPQPGIGSTERREIEHKRRDGSTYRVWSVTLINWVLRYRVVLPDGRWEWMETGPMSDCDENEDQGYAYRGAWTSLLKQVLRSFGGLNHVYRGEYTHLDAERELRARRPAG
jgi:hypothetical protein